MTEEEWMKCKDPEKMLDYLLNKPFFRKYRLFACACVRRLWPMLADVRSREAVEVAERYADNLADSGELEEAFEAASEDSNTDATEAAAYAATWDDVQAAESAAESARYAGGKAERAFQVGLMRCIFGPLPFGPVTLSPKCLTPTVQSLAQAIYDNKNFDKLPILAGALEEAGCNQEDVLKHLRDGGEHVRGCWALDLVLGKS